jgi:uncharacterized MAPEG superfamily protein
MYFAYWMLLAAAFPPYACAGYAKAGRRDNHTRRLYDETLTGIFIAARILYTFAYVTDRATVRTLLFMIGVLCIVGLFVSAGIA